MGDSQIQQNIVPVSDLQLKDLLDLLKKDIMLSLNAHAIATVQTVDLSKKTLTATINYSKTYFKSDKSGAYIPILVPYPPLIDVPFIVFGGGGAGFSAPISPNDQCLILFNDRDLDNWFAGATSGAVATPRLHSLSDGIALVGLRSPVTIDPLRAVMQGPGAAFVGVSATKIKVQNQTKNLNTILQNILTHLINLVSTNAVPGSPVTLNPATIANLTQDATDLAGLLE